MAFIYIPVQYHLFQKLTISLLQTQSSGDNSKETTHTIRKQRNEKFNNKTIMYSSILTQLDF